MCKVTILKSPTRVLPGNWSLNCQYRTSVTKQKQEDCKDTSTLAVGVHSKSEMVVAGDLRSIWKALRGFHFPLASLALWTESPWAVEGHLLISFSQKVTQRIHPRTMSGCETKTHFSGDNRETFFQKIQITSLNHNVNVHTLCTFKRREAQSSSVVYEFPIML